MRQSVKPFVVERKKKRQHSIGPRPLFSRDELLFGADREPDLTTAAPVITSRPIAVREPDLPLSRILSDLTVQLQDVDGAVELRYSPPTKGEFQEPADTTAAA